jgi:hypothetical protein
MTSLPHWPVRGSAGTTVAMWASSLSFLLMSVLTFFVVDATRLCRRFIRLLSGTAIGWDAQTRAKFRAQVHSSVNPRTEWITIELVAERASAVARLIAYPFIVLFLMLVSRLSYFDSWDFPLGIAVVYLLLAVYAIYSALILRQAAEQARRRALDALDEKLLAAHHEWKEGSHLPEEIEVVIQRIKSIRHGAFLPFTQQPVIKTLLFPFGGGMGLLLMDYLAWLG